MKVNWYPSPKAGNLIGADDVEYRVRHPIPMVLHCPRCGGQHVDKATAEWTNPPHRSHLCAGCGCIWRPADVPTTGVDHAETRGKDDWHPDRWMEET